MKTESRRHHPALHSLVVKYTRLYHFHRFGFWHSLSSILTYNEYNVALRHVVLSSCIGRGRCDLYRDVSEPTTRSATTSTVRISRKAGTTGII